MESKQLLWSIVATRSLIAISSHYLPRKSIVAVKSHWLLCYKYMVNMETQWLLWTSTVALDVNGFNRSPDCYGK
jgi:hypothetical protein